MYVRERSLSQLTHESRYIERELRSFLECGILACGFARARCGDCGHDFLVALSCKGRGLCPSCTTRRMAETTAHLVEHVFPQVPVRQWVVTFPKRLRYFLHRDPALLGRVRRSVLRAIETGLQRRCPGAPRGARCGAVSFVQRFGSALNAHTHLHCCVTDGVFGLDADGTLRFHPATALDPAATSAVQRRSRSRVLRTAVRHGALGPEVAADLARWGHGGGFSLHATVRIEADDRAGLERLLRYCARPAFASERLTWDGPDQPVRYTLPKPLHHPFRGLLSVHCRCGLRARRITCVIRYTEGFSRFVASTTAPIATGGSAVAGQV